mmetsp:Transcript_37125/g.103342  ORF Transcript_37125/g.103342 Transcript_37125/m.103342 type:complete len:232 (-) Transcript_37125:17-712(-)
MPGFLGVCGATGLDGPCCRNSARAEMGFAYASAARRRRTNSWPQRSSSMTASDNSATPRDVSSGASLVSEAKRERAFSRAPTAPMGPTEVRARRLSAASFGSTVGRSGKCGRHRSVISAAHCVSSPRPLSWPKRCHVLKEQSAAPATATARTWQGAIMSARPQHSCATSATWPPAFHASTTSVRPPAPRRRSRTSGFVTQLRRTACRAFVAVCQRLAKSLPPMPLSTDRMR